MCCERSWSNKALTFCSLKVDIKGSLFRNDISLGSQCFLPSRSSRKKKIKYNMRSRRETCDIVKEIILSLGMVK